MRRAIGVAVFFGMLGVTAFGLVLTPVFYVLVQRLVEGRENKKVAEGQICRPRLRWRHKPVVTRFSKKCFATRRAAGEWMRGGSALQIAAACGGEIPCSRHEPGNGSAVRFALVEAVEDPVLDSLVDRTLASNNSIRIARARLSESRAVSMKGNSTASPRCLSSRPTSTARNRFPASGTSDAESIPLAPGSMLSGKRTCSED